MPAYLIFSDRSLLDMAKRCPRTIGEFAEVNGVGASKLKDFAERFLQHHPSPSGQRANVTAERSA